MVEQSGRELIEEESLTIVPGDILPQRTRRLAAAGKDRDFRRAALNLMEDAVQSRQAVEKLNAELRASEERLARELAATRKLQFFSALLIEGGDAHALYQTIVDAAVVIMRSDFASMQMLFPERAEGRGELLLLAHYGFAPESAKTFEWVRTNTGCTCGEALRTGRRVMVADVETCEFIAGTPGLEGYRQSGIRAVQTTPLVSRDGRLLGMISTHWRAPHTPAENDLRQFDILVRQAADLIERKRVEEALRESEARYRVLFDLGPVAVYSCDASGVIQKFNSRAAELWGREPAFGDTDERFCGSFKLFRPDGSFMPHEQCPMAEVVSGKISEVRDAEVLIERPDGSRVVVIVNIRSLKTQSGEVTGAVNCFYDITERKQADERQRFLANELAHRGKNLLTVVQAIVSRTLSGERPLAEAREVLARRIQALARSQSIAVTEGFEGVPVAEIIRGEFEAFSDRVAAVGPDVTLNSKAAQTFALLVHELATNATKHGALSRPGGQVAIHWSTEGADAEARFKFQWQERGGPAVTPPTRHGFGSVLIEKAVAQEFEAQPKIRFAPEGLGYEIDAPLSAIIAG